MAGILKILTKISVVPSNPEAFQAWIEQRDTLAFLESHLAQDDIVIYASPMHVFMHIVLVPAALVDPPDAKDLLSWNFTPTSSWGISYDFSEPPSVYISPPLDHTGSKTLNQGEQLVFIRYFDGRLGDSHYIEILQKLVHVLDLHLLSERNAYCRLDKHGDIEDVIQLIELPETEGSRGGSVVTIKRDSLDDYMVLTESVAIFMFDFTRFRPGSFSRWRTETDADLVVADTLSYRSVRQADASYLRGYQLIYPRTPREAIVRRLRNEESEEKERQYATYIIEDWRHQVIADVSCAPDHSTNYFDASENDLPFEVSPAFFRPEVLAKYKADTEKYRLTDRSISCRGAWHLETYDINEAGQVHTYLVYLRRLPYEEQLYWKAYNERPKGQISKRAYTTDFEGSWNLDYDPLRSLRNLLEELGRARVPWWTLRSQDLPEQVQYPVTSSPDEWSTEILRLDQLVVEGFEERWLRKKAQELGRTPAQNFRSLKLIEECLIALDFEEDHAQKITSPLHELHNLRNKIKGHAAGRDALSIRRKVLTDHGTYRKHFHALCEACDESMKTIVETFKGSRFLGV